jgi:hypothetical protein
MVASEEAEAGSARGLVPVIEAPKLTTHERERGESQERNRRLEQFGE